MSTCRLAVVCFHGVCPMHSVLGRFTQPWCGGDHNAVHESQLQESTRNALYAALPWALRANPGRCVWEVTMMQGV